MPTDTASPFRKTAETFIAEAKTLPQKYFVSPEVFARERETIFANQWLCVGHQNDIRGPGDYFVRNVLGESLILVRSQKGEIHAFFNMCRHKGTGLCEEETGRFNSTIQCPYHAWTYTLDGRLTGAPHMEKAPGFEKTNYSLHATEVGLWEEFIFINLSKRPTSIEAAFAPLNAKFSRWNLPQLRSARRIEYDVRANWKLIFENYSECYHCPLVHPTLSKLTPYDAAENDLFEGPFLGGFMPIKGGSMTVSGNACAMPVGDLNNEDAGRVWYYSMFPNLLLSLHPDYVMVHQIWPQCFDRTTILCDWFFHPRAASQPRFNPDDAIQFWDVTNRQDWHVCELSQQGISSRAYQPGPYSPRESIPAAWDREYLRALG